MCNFITHINELALIYDDKNDIHIDNNNLDLRAFCIRTKHSIDKA